MKQSKKIAKRYWIYSQIKFLPGIRVMFLRNTLIKNTFKYLNFTNGNKTTEGAEQTLSES